ncbi:hypothetical protein F5876DRAFT_72197 [Lentinula aff. lateritia]|uniref:Uncharacterized protein n=1 Tax=Lentinula aff. lateritia TaxID=2804960 RepID=A0ACC1UFF8_9AGAR|nr:hypothetical protein F5876DRAFT_72197 [Lentinula aff. lateritia]
MSSPTVSENEIADQIGFSAYFDVVYILGASLFYGLSLPVFALSINVLRQRARNSKPVRFLLILTCLTLFSVTGQFITNVGETLTGLSWSQSPSDSISYLDRMASASARAEPYGIASLIFQVLNAANGTLTVDDDAPSVLGRAIVAQFTSFFAGTHSALVISIIASQRSILESSSAVVGSHREPLTQDVEKGVGALPKRFSTIGFAPGQFVSGESEQSVSGDYGNGFFTTMSASSSELEQED